MEKPVIYIGVDLEKKGEENLVLEFGEVRADYAAGMLLLAYEQVTNSFFQAHQYLHPGKCPCEAFGFHQEIRKAFAQVQDKYLNNQLKNLLSEGK